MIKFSEYINEATKTTDIEKLKKMLPKEFKLEDYFELAYNVYKPFGNREYNIVSGILKEEGLLDKAIISKSAYVKNMKWADENGYGNYGTPTKQYQEEWEEKVQDKDYEWLINQNALANENIGKNDFFKKMASLITKKIGKIGAAEKVLYSCFRNNDNSYDRMGSFENYARPKLLQLWDNDKDVYNLFSKNKYDSPLLEYVRSLR